MEQPSKSQLFILSFDNCIQYSNSMSSSSSPNKYFSIVSIFVWKLAFASQLEFGWIFQLCTTFKCSKSHFKCKKIITKTKMYWIRKPYVCVHVVTLCRLEVTFCIILCHFHWTKLYMHINGFSRHFSVHANAFMFRLKFDRIISVTSQPNNIIFTHFTTNMNISILFNL